jgi:hypothetical protein
VISGEFVIAGGDAPPVLEAAEHASDEVSSFAGVAVERLWALSGRVVGHDRRRALVDEEPAQAVGVVGAAGGAEAGRRRLGDQDEGGANVAELARRRLDRKRPSEGAQTAWIP